MSAQRLPLVFLVALGARRLNDMRVVAIVAMTVLGALFTGGALAQNLSACGPTPALSPGGSTFGPFDYRTATAWERRLVEGSHFGPNIENLQSGNRGTAIGAEIHYTLGAFPNHPRALLAMSNLGQKTKVAKPPGAQWTVDCYFDRAIRWRPDDPSVRLVFGIHLIRRGQNDIARVQLGMAEEHALDEGSFRYNLGLALFDIGEVDRALEQAWRAHALGYDLPGLKRRLEKIGKWRDADK